MPVRIRIAILSIGFMVSRHAADKEVEQERFVGGGGAIEHVQFVVRMGDDLLLVVFGLLVLLEQFGDAEFLEEDAHIPDPVGESALGVAVLALRHALFSHPAHIVQQDLLVISALVDIRHARMLDERINGSPIFADGLGIKTAGFAVGEILFGSRCQCDPA